MPEVSINDQPFCIYNINIRCLLANHAELCFHVQLRSPHVIFIQESWLHKCVECKEIPNYIELSRRHRSDSESRGGVIAFVRKDVRNVVHVSNSSVGERSWHLLHTEIWAA